MVVSIFDTITCGYSYSFALLPLLAVSLIGLSAVTALSVLAGPGDNEDQAPPGAVILEEGELTWEEVQRLQNEQKFEAAFDVVGAIRERAEADLAAAVEYLASVDAT